MFDSHFDVWNSASGDIQSRVKFPNQGENEQVEEILVRNDTLLIVSSDLEAKKVILTGLTYELRVSVVNNI